MSGIRSEIKGKEAVLETLAKAVAAMEEPKPLYEQIGLAMLESTDRRFEEGEDPDGNPWIESLRVRLNGGVTLTDKRGRIPRSMTMEASNSGVAWGTNEIIALIHQTGGTINAKTPKGLRFRAGGNGGWVTKMSVEMPQRAFLGVNADDEKEINALSESYLKTAFGEGGADAHR
jgi:phage virion morphogenesis protein